MDEDQKLDPALLREVVAFRRIASLLIRLDDQLAQAPPVNVPARPLVDVYFEALLSPHNGQIPAVNSYPDCREPFGEAGYQIGRADADDFNRAGQSFFWLADYVRLRPEFCWLPDRLMAINKPGLLDGVSLESRAIWNGTLFLLAAYQGKKFLELAHGIYPKVNPGGPGLTPAAEKALDELVISLLPWPVERPLWLKG